MKSLGFAPEKLDAARAARDDAKSRAESARTKAEAAKATALSAAKDAEFAARHVNDWGERTCAEILAGVERFLAAHPFVDPERVGCIGASYGGFMTLSLLTKTDRFAAAISHAGIADLASYWGSGFWGYQYSAIASAGMTISS